MKNVNDLVLEIQELATRYNQAGKIVNKLTMIYQTMTDKVGDIEKNQILNKINEVTTLLENLEQNIIDVQTDLAGLNGSAAANRKLKMAQRFIENSPSDSVYIDNTVFAAAGDTGSYLFKTPYTGVVRSASFNKPGYGVSNTSGPVGGTSSGTGAGSNIMGSNYAGAPDTKDSYASGDKMNSGLTSVEPGEMAIRTQFFNGRHYTLFIRGGIRVSDTDFNLISELNTSNIIVSPDPHNMYREMKISQEGLIFLAYSTYDNSIYTHTVTCLDLEGNEVWSTNKVLGDLITAPSYGNTNIITAPDSPCFDAELTDYIYVMRGSKYITKYEKYTGIEVAHEQFVEYNKGSAGAKSDRLIGQLFHNGKFLWLTMGGLDPKYEDSFASNQLSTGATYMIDPTTLQPYADSQGYRELDVSLPTIAGSTNVDYKVCVGSVDRISVEKYNGPNSGGSSNLFAHWAPASRRSQVAVDASVMQFIFPVVNYYSIDNPSEPITNRGAPTGHVVVFQFSEFGSNINQIIPGAGVKYPCYPGETITTSKSLSGGMGPTSLRLMSLQFDNKGMLVFKKCRDIAVPNTWTTNDENNRDAIVVTGSNICPSQIDDNKHSANIMMYEFNNSLGSDSITHQVWPYVPGTPSDIYC